MATPFIRFIGVPALALAMTLVAGLAQANTIRVNRFAQQDDDPAACTITQAIRAAELDLQIAGCDAGNGADIIHVPAGIYSILVPYELDPYGNSTAFPYVTTDITIEGEYHTAEPQCPTDGTPRAAGCDTVIERHAGSFFTFRFFTIEGRQFAIRDLTLRGGNVSGPEGGGAILARTFRTYLFPGPPRVTVSVTNVRFANNAGTRGGAIADVGDYRGPYVDFTIDRSTFTSNTVVDYGGGVFVSPGSSLTVSHSLFDSNNGGEWGGGVATINAADAPFDISDTTFIGNHAVQYGGAVFHKAPRLTRVTLDSNWVVHSGGALYGDGGRPVITDSTFKGNRARRGGAIQVAEGSIEIAGSTFTENVSTDFEAGVLYLDDRTRTSRIVNSTISGNYTASAGAITLRKGALFINNSTIVFNTNTPGGGTIAIYPGFNGDNEITLANSIVAGNTSNGGRADIYVDPASGDRVVSLGYNVIGTNTSVESVFTGIGDQAGTDTQPLDPRLLPLEGNGGFTKTHAIGAMSPALGAGSPTSCEPVDQRGTTRPAPCDSGAFEEAVYFTLTVTINASAPGAVTVPPVINDCRNGVCRATVVSGQQLRLTAMHGDSSDFTGWSGDCTGTAVTCDITMTGDRDVAATFAAWGGATTTTLAISPRPADVGEPVTLSAKVVAAPTGRGTPSGNVRFIDLTFPRQPIEAAIGANGIAEFTTTDLAPGDHTIQAIYLGNAVFTTSSGLATVRIGAVPNFPPTFATQPAAPSVGRSSGPQTVPGFAFGMSATEGDQSLVGFTVTPSISLGTLAFSVPPALSLDGTLTYAATDGTTGIATFSATLRDDGGTANGGRDTSTPHDFTISVIGPPPMLSLIINETIGVTDEPTFNPLNTSPGASVDVEPAVGVAVTFDEVTNAGTTEAVVADAPAAPPSGFDFTTPPVTWDIHTTSVFHGPVAVCLTYPSSSISARLMHFENGAWVDRTVSRDGAASVVCGSVMSLSPFAVMVPRAAQGRMTGHGSLGEYDDFDFRVNERMFGVERGHLTFTHVTPKSGKQAKHTQRFESTGIDNIAFWDDPAYRPARRGRLAVDSAIFTGTGAWNGAAGYRFEVEVSDQGEKGRGRDEFRIVIRDGNGLTVFSTDGQLTSGNIQSQRVAQR